MAWLTSWIYVDYKTKSAKSTKKRKSRRKKLIAFSKQISQSSTTSFTFNINAAIPKAKSKCSRKHMKNCKSCKKENCKKMALANSHGVKKSNRLAALNQSIEKSNNRNDNNGKNVTFNSSPIKQQTLQTQNRNRLPLFYDDTDFEIGDEQLMNPVDLQKTQDEIQAMKLNSTVKSNFGCHQHKNLILSNSPISTNNNNITHNFVSILIAAYDFCLKITVTETANL